MEATGARVEALERARMQQAHELITRASEIAENREAVAQLRTRAAEMAEVTRMSALEVSTHAALAQLREELEGAGKRLQSTTL
eukprot:1970553-Prymnesium_polylepis.1